MKFRPKYAYQRPPTIHGIEDAGGSIPLSSTKVVRSPQAHGECWSLLISRFPATASADKRRVASLPPRNLARCRETATDDPLYQLLKDTSWRDTKTAIILFNRDTALTTVLEKLPALLATHACFKRQAEVSGETRFRCVMHQPSDVNRELILTVLVFDVPR
jgi:hypothetical protein